MSLKISLIRVPDPSCISDTSDEPLGLLYLASMLEKAGHQVIIDDLAGKANTWKYNIDFYEVDIFGIQLFTPTAHIGIGIAQYIRKVKPNAKIVCGGPHASALFDDDELLENFDHIFIGEAEYSFLKWVNSYDPNIPEENHKIIRCENPVHLDALPFPARHLVNMSKYTRTVDGERCFGMFTSRGCVWECKFCDKAVSGKGIRFRSIKNIILEIKECILNYGVRKFEFYDDLFAIRKDRLQEFKEESEGLNLIYRCNARTDLMTPEIAKLLFNSGCKAVAFGIESGNQHMLDLMNKRNTVENNYKGIQIANEAGLETIGYFIIGFPNETKETIQQTLEFIEKSNLTSAQCYMFQPTPGTPVFKNPEKFGIKDLSKDYSQYYLVTGQDGHGGKTIDTEFLSADELQEEMKKVRIFLKEHNMKTYAQKQKEL